ncbi:sugar ABC transporter ATP-binding protein [Haloferax sp. Atlit-10N]|uniref:ATP-binding cassette domain-containing protein n=1 Tax=unclassified Haloferax TaxID=2625095 RepID=UPI000E237CC2|nr:MULTISPECIES: ATP-binding cassette domain-containing protein [unclassified Haloferax]RDZ44518.1 sugar ABC transporter ATP-binding protein [Haloferax sp. Atlit-16N]RDZ56327.1 sugar ABC transporter ATP-binding protein [Haloferax sp. Atlit-10N]
MSEIIRVENLSKQFGQVQALEDVSFSIRENEVFALLGDNGAGKSTLIKILSGVLQRTSGEIYINGEQVDLKDYNDAEEMGIETVYQDLAIAPNRTVAENIYLGNEILLEGPLGRLLNFVDDDRMDAESRELLSRLELDLNPRSEVKNFSGGEQQSVAIARALQSDPEIVIMDEPTSALSIEATRRILELIKRLRDQGVTIILISHNLENIFEVADRAAVLASGRLIGVEDLEGVTDDELVGMMMGRGRSSS